jgi:hypothetical protein
VSSPMDSATWVRWWFAAIPYRALRRPAWNRGKPGGPFQPSSGPMSCPLSASFPIGVGTSGYPLRCGRVGGDLPVG